MEAASGVIYPAFEKIVWRKRVILAAFVLFAVFSAFLSLWTGHFGESFSAVWDDPLERKIFLLLRLPRVAAGVLVGAGLAASGVLAQAILRNPLASPFTLGISSGAAFGAALGIFFGVLSLWRMAFLSFIFAAMTSGGIVALAKFKNSKPETMVLGGVAIMFLFAAATSLLQYMATENQVQAIVFWGFGNLGRVGWKEVAVSGAMVLIPLPFAIKLSWDLNTLSVGEDAAASLGANVERVRVMGIVIISLMAAGSICFTGIIGFIGLVSPHITRLCLGADHRFLLPGAALFGVGLVSISDALARNILAPQILPIGIITAFLGVPFFFWLLLRKKQRA
jgi:iron complex transport system permease protein